MKYCETFYYSENLKYIKKYVFLHKKKLLLKIYKDNKPFVNSNGSG